MGIDHQRLLAAIDEGRENSYGTDEQSVLGQRRAQAIEAYLGLNTNPAPAGRSQVVDRSVYETIHTMLPSLVRIFAGSSDDVCKFIPVGPEDEQGAEQTTAVIGNVVTEQNQWEQICTDWIHDAMLLSNGYAMAYWDQSERLIRERYDGQSDDQVAAILQDKAVRVVEHSQKPDEEANEQMQQAYQQAMQQYKMVAQQAQQAGQMPPPPPQKPQPAYLHDLVIDRLENDGGVCIKVLPPEHCYVGIDTPDWTLKDCPYFEFRSLKTIADLRAMGLEVPDDITDDDSEDTDEDYARDRFGEDRENDIKGVMRQVWARMIWVRCDAEDDGQSRLYYTIVVGRTILYAEPCSRIPVASMTPQPLPHRHIGMSIAETIVDIQNIKTAVKRGGLDNLYLASNGRYAVSAKVNLADFLDARPGGVVRMIDDAAMPAEGHIMPLQHPFAFGEIIGGLEYFDQERQNRTGAMRGAAGLEANAMNRAAVGTTMAMQSHSAMRTEHVARMMAPAVEYLFSLVHELVSKHQNKPKIIKMRGRWTPVDPQAWRTKRDVRISVGVGAGNKESMMMQLQGVLAAQMQIGLPLGLVARDNIHATNVEILKLAGFSNPDKFWPDPTRLPPQQQPPSPEQIKAQASIQLEQFKAQQDQMKFQAEQQLEQQRMQMQAELDRNREEMQARQKMLEAQMNAERESMQQRIQAEQEQRRLEFEQWKASLDAAVKLEIANKSADTTMQAAQMAKPDTRIDEVLSAVQQLIQETQTPVEIVRGPDGRAIGIKKGERVRSIQRGPDGRAAVVQ